MSNPNDGIGGLDLNALLGQVQQMQQQMSDAQDEARSRTVTGSSGGGKVTATATGTGEFTGISIDPSVVDPDEVDLLEDLVLAAIRDALTQVSQINEQSLGQITGGLGGLFGN
jgi:nucleoid-associated protein EbfC